MAKKSFPEAALPETSKTGLLGALRDGYLALRDAADGIEADAFFDRPAPDSWSPAEHALHLVKSVNAVAQGLSFSKWLVRLRFGKSPKGSRSYDEVVALYQGMLAGGARAGGRYVPRVDPPPKEEAEEAKEAVLAKWERAFDRLEQGLEKWSEKDLDRLRFPHPLLGKLTVREMLFFTRYHNLHHLLRIEETRRPGTPMKPLSKNDVSLG